MSRVEVVQTVESGGRTVTCNASVEETTHVLGPVRIWSVKAAPHTVVVAEENGAETTMPVRDLDAMLRKWIWLGATLLALTIRLVLKARGRNR